MKRILCVSICAIISIQAYSQSSKAILKAGIEIFGSTDSLVGTINPTIPEAFKEASVVSVADISIQKYKASGERKTRESIFRVVLKLQDAAALDKYSTFSFENSKKRYSNSKSESIFALRIHKNSGEIIDIDLTELEKNGDNEVAIPNLEIGDIIDYGLKTEEVTLYDCTNPQIITLNETYPILKGIKRYYLHKTSYLNVKSMNGAPEVERLAALDVYLYNVYQLKYENLGAYSDEIWAPLRRTEQTVKVQVCQKGGREVASSALILGEPGKIKSEMTEEDLKKSIKNSNGIAYTSAEWSYYLKWYKANYTERNFDLTPAEQLHVYFYFLKYHILVFDPATAYYKSRYHSKQINEAYFLRNMKYFAEKNDIEYDLVISSSKYNSTFEDVILLSELTTIFRFKDDEDEWVYLQNPTAYQTIEYVSSSLGGQDGMGYFSPDERYRDLTIPETTTWDNVQSVEMNITPNLETKEVEIKTRNSMLGIFKFSNSKEILDNTDYHLDMAKAMLPEGMPDVMMESKKKKKGIAKSITNVESDPDEKLKSMKEMRSDDFDLDEYKSFSLVNSGVISSEDSLVYEDVFTMKDIVSKAGPNFIIDLSTIAIGQISFTEEEIAERVNDIYINYPKTFSYKYVIEIPEGYAAYGLETLNEDVETPYGMVKLSASTDGNTVNIFLKKQYKRTFVNKEKWAEYMSFITPAMKINEAKIVLKKEGVTN